MEVILMNYKGLLTGVTLIQSKWSEHTAFCEELKIYNQDIDIIVKFIAALEVSVRTISLGPFSEPFLSVSKN